ncbi:MAG: FAD-dependent oxidoreductase, partial [Novosphingobium sp.]
MLVAHVEAQGVWLIEGGMSALADALMRLAQMHGATFRFGTAAALIEATQGRASGVILQTGERIAADAVIANADPEALAGGRLGRLAAMAVSSHGVRKRSLSAMVWLANARTGGVALQRHNVFFSRDYPREFADIQAGAPPGDPSVDVCAQDRDTDAPIP